MSPKEFVIDYIQRHQHPANAFLHIIGVPAAFAGVYMLITANIVLGLVLIFVGYLFQYWGHRAQGNEVGEVTLIKSLLRKFKSRAGGNV